MTVDEILRAKGRGVHTLDPHATVDTAVHRLRLEEIGALVISADGTHADGIFSERDLVRILSEDGCEALRMEVGSVMTRHVQTCRPDSKIQDVMATMTRMRFRHMPVIEDDELIGLVSIGDLVRSRFEELETESLILRERVLGNS